MSGARRSGAAQILVRAGKLVVQGDKLGAERGKPKVACLVERELRSLGERDGGVIETLQMRGAIERDIAEARGSNARCSPESGLR